MLYSTTCAVCYMVLACGQHTTQLGCVHIARCATYSAGCNTPSLDAVPLCQRLARRNTDVTLPVPASLTSVLRVCVCNVSRHVVLQLSANCYCTSGCLKETRLSKMSKELRCNCYPRDIALRGLCDVNVSVCDCPSHAGIVFKRLNLS